jgi:alpha-ribazole phosphatase CobZ
MIPDQAIRGLVHRTINNTCTSKYPNKGNRDGVTDQPSHPIITGERTTIVMFEIEDRLREKGVTFGAMLDSAMEIYVSHGMTEEAARADLLAKFKKYLRDPNVSSLLLGAMLLEDELYWKKKDSEIKDDPVFLIADEIIGMAIAECIGGTYAKFEFTRYDQKKPGILSTLGPFLDDAVAGLIAGCTSRLYTECVECG